MKYSFPYIPRRSLFIAFLCMAYSLMQAFAMEPLVPYPLSLLLLKSMADALVFVGIGWVMFIVIPSSNYVKLDAIQRIINSIALGLLVVFLWTILFLITSVMVFGRESVADFRSLVPMVAMLGILIYIVLILYIQRDVTNVDREEIDATIDQQNLHHQTEAKAITSEQPEQNAINDIDYLERVVVKTGQRIHVILTPEIVYIQSDGDYVQIVTDQNKFLKEDTMKYFEANLPDNLFVRVHRSYIVNLEKISRIETYEKNNQMLLLKNGDKIKASASGYKALREALGL